MAGFRSYRSYDLFAESVRTSRRYLLTKEHLEFLETLAARGAYLIYPPGLRVWRAQAGCSEQSPEFIPYRRERMIPYADRAKEGRANPKGIPCLYVASDRETAMSEVRPWRGSYISVTSFRTVRHLRILDLSGPVNKEQEDEMAERKRELATQGAEETDAKRRHALVDRDVEIAFSTPVEPDDFRSDYAPTQIVAEFLRHTEIKGGIDGLCYRSSVRDWRISPEGSKEREDPGSIHLEGFNFALFDSSCAEPVESQVCVVTSVNYEFADAGPLKRS